MSIEANAVYVYNGSITDLLSGVHKAAESMKLVTGNENVTASAFSLRINSALFPPAGPANSSSKPLSPVAPLISRLLPI